MPSVSRIRAILLSIVLMLSCAIEDEVDQEQEAVSREPLAGGVTPWWAPGHNRLPEMLQGTGLNGLELSGHELAGRWIEWISLQEVELRNGRYESVTLRATQFCRHEESGCSLAVKRAIFTATLDNGTSLLLRIEGVSRAEDRSTRSLYLYEVTYAADGQWSPLCGLDDDGEPILAFPLNHRWDYREGEAGGGSRIEDDRVFTFGCQGAVLAKCVEMGYWPWAQVTTCTRGPRGIRNCRNTPLFQYHQACTRMLRADFCGDGNSHTEDDVSINAYDGLGIRMDSEEWAPEAEWNEAGAVCAARERLDLPEPWCWDELALDSCGDPAHLGDDTLLISEVEEPVTP